MTVRVNTWNMKNHDEAEELYQLMEECDHDISKGWYTFSDEDWTFIRIKYSVYNVEYIDENGKLYF